MSVDDPDPDPDPEPEPTPEPEPEPEPEAPDPELELEMEPVSDPQERSPSSKKRRSQKRAPRIVDKRRPAATEASGSTTYDGDSPSSDVETPRKPYRFKVGDRVLALTKGSMTAFGTKASQWRTGSISKLDYWEEGWEAVSPYQILLDSGCGVDARYVAAPHDDDSCVRHIPTMAKDFPADPEDPECRCNQGGKSCPGYHCCEDGLSCANYHFCGKEGRRKTRLLRMLQQKQQAQQPVDDANLLCPPCDDSVQTVKQQQQQDVSLDELLAFVEGPSGAGGAAANTPKKRPKSKKKRDKRNKDVVKASEQKSDPLGTVSQVAASTPQEQPEDSGTNAAACDKDVRKSEELKSDQLSTAEDAASIPQEPEGSSTGAAARETVEAAAAASVLISAENSLSDEPWQKVSKRSQPTIKRNRRTSSPTRGEATAPADSSAVVAGKTENKKQIEVAADTTLRRGGQPVLPIPTPTTSGSDAAAASRSALSRAAAAAAETAEELEARIAALKAEHAEILRRGASATAAPAAAAAGSTLVTAAGTDDVDVEEWLRGFKLERYAGAIKDLGYDDMIFVREANGQEVEGLIADVAMKRPHAKVFRRAFAELIGEAPPAQAAAAAVSSSASAPSDVVAAAAPAQLAVITPPSSPSSLPPPSPPPSLQVVEAVKSQEKHSIVLEAISAGGRDDDSSGVINVEQQQRQWPRLGSASWKAAGKCCSSHEAHCKGNGKGNGNRTGEPVAAAAAGAADGSLPSISECDSVDCDCDCDCHTVAAAGRDVVLAKLVEGMDFSPLFKQELFEQTDVDTEHALRDFERTLSRAHGWCAVAKAC